MSTSAERMRSLRGHRAGDHGECTYDRCKHRREIEYRNEEHLFALAVFEELDRAGIDAEAWFGNGYTDAREAAEAELPYYDYLSREPDSIHRIQARSAVRDTRLFPVSTP